MERKQSRRKKLTLGVQAACMLFAELGGLSVAMPSHAAQHCELSFATVVAIQGEVRYRATSQAAWQPATLDQALCAGAELQVAPGSRAALRLSNGGAIPLDQNTHIIVRGLAADGRTVQIEVVSGSINVATSRASPIQVVTPHGQVKTDGGDFAVRVTPQESALSVFDGDVAVSNPEGSMLLHSDETVFFAQLSAPKRDITLKPQELVQWVVQYPVLINASDVQPVAWAAAARAYEQGRSLDALISLDQVPDTARSAEYYIYRANLLLQAGQVDEARTNVESGLKLTPGLPEAWALLAILDLGKNDAAQALRHAEKAIQLGPQSATAHLAHSYALQAKRQPEMALASARRVVELAPNNALGYTRLAELELACGDRRLALRAAQQAEQIDPKLVDAKVMLGFVYLSQVKLKRARAAFNSAVQLNSADPRARMGLGLTRIRQGQLQAGREDLELAASLDTENPLLRTYLGRAYEEEGRNSESAAQYARAQRADPQDPTPYSFNAIRLANLNQRVSAVHEIREALARNDNRAVYRGQTLLAEDQALRRANAVSLELALGFDDSARADASSAVVHNPLSGVAHRALGDALASLPRADPTRRSEYLQGLMREPLGAPAPPLFLSEGVQRSALAPQQGFFRAAEPGQVGYNEFGAAFKTRPWQVLAEGTVGNKDSAGDQVQFSGSAGNVGWSLSHLKFKTDGLSDFNRLDNSVLQGILQVDVTQQTRLFAEANQFNSDRQDIINRAEPFFFSPQDVSEDRWRYRLGLRQRIGEAHELLLLGAWEDSDQISDTLPTEFNLLTEPIRQQIEVKTRTPEFQYRYQAGIFKGVLGGVFGKSEAVTAVGFDPAKATSRTSYAYGYLNLPYQLNLELGISRDNQQDTFSLAQRYTNHKFGLRWEAIPGGTLRIASFRSTNRALASSATLEPSQVAGFNQYYNDVFGVRNYRRGLGWDQRLGSDLSFGVEASRRELQVPVGGLYEQQDDREGRAYLNWSVPRASLSRILPGTEAAISLSYDRVALTRDGQATGAEQIRDYQAQHFRLGAVVNHSSGLGLSLGLTRVQNRGVYEVLDFDGINLVPLPFNDNFWTVDTALTYRLPNKRGQIVIGALNLTDRRGFQYLELDTQNPRFAPQRYVYGKLLLNF